MSTVKNLGVADHVLEVSAVGCQRLAVEVHDHARGGWCRDRGDAAEKLSLFQSIEHQGMVWTDRGLGDATLDWALGPLLCKAFNQTAKIWQHHGAPVFLECGPGQASPFQRDVSLGASSRDDYKSHVFPAWVTNIPIGYENVRDKTDLNA